MGFINQGSQFITFDFKHRAKGSDFNKLNRNVLPPGIYSGLKITYVGNNVYVNQGTCVFNCAYGIENNLQVKINFDSIYNYGIINPSTLGQNEVIYLEYEYGEVLENYADFKHTSFNSFDFSNKNLIVIGELLYDGSYNISSISYTRRSLGFNNSDLNHAIPDSTRYYNIEDESKFFKIDGSQLPSGTRKINVPYFTEVESDILLTNTSNTTIIKNNLDISNELTVTNNTNLKNNLNVTGTTNLKTTNISNDLNLSGTLNVNIVNFDYDTILNSSSTVIVNFTSKSFIVLKNTNSSLDTVITLSIPQLVNEFRTLYLLVKSNGRYSFSSNTSQGGTLRFPSGYPPSVSINNAYDLYSFLTNGTDVFSTFAFNYTGVL